MTPIARLAIIGHGRMGRAVSALAAERGFAVVAVLGSADLAPAGITRELLHAADVAIEFTTPAAAAPNVRACAALGCPVVSGTTGWDDERPGVEADVRAANGALLWAPNFSLGVHVFARVAAFTAALVAASDAGFDSHLTETHHAAKRDAPSGTARLVAALVRASSGRDLPTTSVRMGSVPGTHELLFDAPFEQLRIEHVARDRRVFAAGALAAARWLIGRHGVFTLDHLFGTG